MQVITEICKVEELIEEYEGVIFDLDDTLYSEKEYVRSGYKKVAEAMGGGEETQNRLWELFEEKRNVIDEILIERGEFSREKQQKLLNIYREQVPDIHMYSGASEMLQRIKQKGKKLGLITDGRITGQKNKIRVLKLDDTIEDIIITDECGGVEFRKPNPIAYIMLQERWRIPFERMVYIGDNIKKDFVAPEKLGMGSIYFKNPEGMYT